MKRYSIIILILFTSTIFSQSVTDRVLVKFINQYRIENNLDTLKFTKLGYKAANHHNEYLSNHPEVGITHKENNDTPWQYERLNKYNNSKNRIWVSAENLYATTINPDIDLNSIEIANWVAKQTIKSWKHSEGHNLNLLLKTAKYVGIHTIITEDNRMIVTYVTYSFSEFFEFN